MIQRLGEQYAQYSGTNYALFMPHGTDSISAALAGALDLDGFSDGGEVIVPNYTFVATARCSIRTSVHRGIRRHFARDIHD